MENITEQITPDVVETVETPAEPTDNGVQNTEGQAPEVATQGEEQTERFDDGEKFAKAFSKRLNKEKEKLSKEYEPFKKVIALASKQFGMSEDEYIKSILDDYSEEEEEDAPKGKDERDVLIEELLEEKRQKEIAGEWERQAKALQKIDPNVSMDKITDDMLSMADEKKIPLEYIYAYDLLTSDRENFEKAIEDKIMAKINKLNGSTAGSMTSGKVETNAPSVNSMSAKDFEALKERVKRGERVNL